ncbi:ABC transporter permease [Rurimicrobium arvi]|uniref:ABC transporter permease n=1 Tax=Rurimicrobium arvi TaxID=2049916 RepID=A0ABP8MG08_9BACT
MKIGINTEIAFTYMVSRRKQTIVAALGVTFGISMFIFMNALITGSNEWSEKSMLSSTPHLRLYNDPKMSDNQMLDKYAGGETINLISNPKFVNTDSRIADPDAVLQQLQHRAEITAMSKQVSTNVIYANSNVQENGNVSGVNIREQDKMFDISSTMISGSVDALAGNPDGIIIGTGLAEKLNVSKGDYITLSTTNAASKRLEIVGIFKTTIKGIDNTRSYTNISFVQQLLRKDRNYITDIYINIKDYNNTTGLARSIASETGYTVETWQSNNEQSLAGKKIRDVIANSVVITILIVAGFGIYNILNMVIYEKIKEIAILKATGFQSGHIISIFIRQALFIGVVGAVAGLLFGWLISFTVSKIYIGLGNVAYLPIAFQLRHYVQGAVFGIVTAFFAGYIPAVKASKVDPVTIIRG